jgi:hypothetical protein
MSKDYYAEGGVTIAPPLNHAEVRKYQEWAGESKNDKYRRDERDIYAEIITTTDATDDGDIARMSATQVVPRYVEQAYSRYYTERDLRELIELFPAHDFHGVIEVESEGYGEDHEHYRLYAGNHQLHRVDPVVTWTDPWASE